MSVARDKVKRDHELYNIREFLDWHRQRYKSAFRIVERPDPPDAIIRSGRTVRWVESTTAFWNKAYARDEYSYATPGEVHKPMPKVPFHVGPDEVFAANFIDLVRQKLEKTSYEKFRDQYGPGYLVVRVMYPLFGAWTMQLMKDAWMRALVTDKGCFRSVYIAFRSRNGLAFMRWPCS